MELEIVKPFMGKLVFVVRLDAGQVTVAKGVVKAVTKNSLLLDRFGNALALDLGTIQSIREVNNRNGNHRGREG